MALNPELAADCPEAIEQRRQKRTKRRWVLVTLATAGTAAALPWLAGAGEPLQSLLYFDAVVGLAPALAFVTMTFQEIIREDCTTAPVPLEHWMPLHGRWLRVLLCAPGMLIMLAMVWAVSFAAVVFAELMLGIALGALVNLFWRG